MGIFPECFKTSKVTPVHKAGDISNVTNYRPILILNSFSKVFKKLSHSVIYAHISPFIYERQHCFVRKKSTLSNLLSFIDHVAESLDQNIQLDAIYTHFAKAFDKLNITILLRKLESFGISGELLNWFRTYLEGRQQCVNFGGCLSETVIPTSGIRQGSLLGPLLFVIFINDLPDSLVRRILGFADDFKIFQQIRSLM